MKQQNVEKAQEIALATGKGILSQLPIAGPILAEWLNVALPNKRLERIEKMLTYFAAKVGNLPPEFLREKLNDPIFSDLFEEGIYSAAKAMTEERIGRIANILSCGIHEDASAVVSQSYIRLLDMLDDYELALFIKISESIHTKGTVALTAEEFMDIKEGMLTKIAGYEAYQGFELSWIYDQAFSKLQSLNIVELAVPPFFGSVPNDSRPTHIVCTRMGNGFSYYIRGKQPGYSGEARRQD